MQVKDMILVSDLDGTLLPESGIISDKNINAIKRFKELGGTFCVATGRSSSVVKPILDRLCVDGPVIVNNGAAIYDPTLDKELWVKEFDDSCKDVLRDIRSTFPNIGIIVVAGKKDYYIFSKNDTSKSLDFLNKTVTFHQMDTDELPKGSCKVFFLIEKDDIVETTVHIINQKYEGVEFTMSGDIFLEMMPKGINKGYPFEVLLSYYGKNINNSAAIGDYSNDMGMIKKAKIGAAMGNAVPELKKVADIIVDTCNNNGFAEFVDYLINNSESL